jgi:hypothetical protein
MKNYKLPLLALGLGTLCIVKITFATNPLIMDQFTADPTARVFEGRIYVYPSHDIPATPGRVNVRSASSTGGAIEIHLDKAGGPLVARVEIGKASDWKVVNSLLADVPASVHDLVVTQNGDSDVELDWISFE